jgi:hypothetical protein
MKGIPLLKRCLQDDLLHVIEAGSYGFTGPRGILGCLDLKVYESQEGTFLCMLYPLAELIILRRYFDV